MSNKRKLSQLVIGALGVVFGDIGTSPLYALKTCFVSNDLAINQGNVFGIISLICWSLTIIVSLQYLCLILRADNNGEGGILILTTLCARMRKLRVHRIVMMLGIIGTAFFYGDGVITPAISVIGALEGLSVINNHMTPFIPALSIIILIMLFMVQKKGSHKMGLLFGPIMAVWFLTLAYLGLRQVIQYPNILYSLNPYYGLKFIIQNKMIGLISFGAIVLVVTGAEALYADLGHFDKKSIRCAWFFLVFPALLLNYCGQGALLLTQPTAIENPFYLLMPEQGLYPLIFISMLATIIASQSIISGVFSISWQAIQLGYFPRMRVVHTSNQQIGQVYVPVINYIMMTITILIVILFKHSHELASAYGITVTSTMICTTILAAILAYNVWKWSLPKLIMIFTPLLLLDITFFSTSIHKFIDGGWLPLSVAMFAFTIITTWRKGRTNYLHQIKSKYDFNEFMTNAINNSHIRIPGVAVFMSHNPDQIPTALEAHLIHNKYLHEKIIFLSIVITDEPRVSSRNRLDIEVLNNDIYIIKAYYGFSEVPNVENIINKASEEGLDISLAEASFFMSRNLPVITKNSHFCSWRGLLFIFLFRNAVNAVDFFKIPHHQVIELGTRFKV